MAQNTVVGANRIQVPDLHDGHLVGLFTPCADFAIVLASDRDGHLCCLLLEGVEGLRATDIKEGNIILDVRVGRQCAVDVDNIAYVFEAPTTHRSVLKAAERIQNGDLTLVEISSSYGGSLIGLCKAVESRAGVSALIERLSVMNG